MPSELKVVAYILAAVAVLSLFFTGIAPMLLNAPPTGFMLVAVALVMAVMLYILSFGPLWVLQRTGPARLYLRTQLNATTAIFGLVMALCVCVPLVPTVASVVSGSFAGATLLLRAVAGEDFGRPIPRHSGELIG
jgi:hypothetical protein